MWPNAKISVMGGQQAAGVLSTVASRGNTWTKEEKEKFEKSIVDKFNQEGSPYYSTARLLLTLLQKKINLLCIIHFFLDYLMMV